MVNETDKWTNKAKALSLFITKLFNIFSADAMLRYTVCAIVQNVVELEHPGTKRDFEIHIAKGLEEAFRETQNDLKDEEDK